MNTKKIHVAYIVSQLGASGPTKQLSYIIDGLDFSEFSVSIITLSKENNYSLKSEFSNYPIEYYCLDSRSSSNPFMAYLSLRKLTNQLQIDLLHSQGIRADMCCSFLRKIPRISSQRNNPFDEYPPLYGKFKGYLMACLHVFALRRIDQVVACSKTLSLEDKKYRIPATYIRNGIPILPKQSDLAEPSSISASEFFSQSGINVFFVYAGPLVARKNPNLLINAFAQPELKNMGLVVLGTGPLLQNCQDLASGKKNIFIAGGVKNVTPYLHRADCYISASASEGIPNSVLEATRLGKPSILSNIPAHKEIFDLCPTIFSLFTLDDSRSLVDAVVSFEKSERTNKVAQAVLRNFFDSTQMSTEYQKLYRKSIIKDKHTDSRRLRSMSLESLVNKGGSRTTWFRRLRDYTFTHSDLLWSRGWYRHVDHIGDCSFLYRAFPTRYPVDNLSCLRGKKGLIWLRLGNYPIRNDWGNHVKNRIGDVATFDRDVIGKLGGPTILITTDGDMSVPGDLPNGVAERILDDPNICGWFTQNYDGSLRHKKLFPIPIGLGLHVGITNRLKGVTGQSHLFNRAMNKRLNENDRIPRIWSDTHLKTHPGFFGDPRETLTQAIQTKSSFKYLDFPNTRIPQKEIWKNYGRYRFVISLPGHGLDCYRTWEALALGACVITVASPLDELLHNYRVISLNVETPNDWSILNSEKWMQHQFEQLIKKPVVSLSWRPWVKQIRDLLEKN